MHHRALVRRWRSTLRPRRRPCPWRWRRTRLASHPLLLLLVTRCPTSIAHPIRNCTRRQRRRRIRALGLLHTTHSPIRRQRRLRRTHHISSAFHVVHLPRRTRTPAPITRCGRRCIWRTRTSSGPRARGVPVLLRVLPRSKRRRLHALVHDHLAPLRVVGDYSLLVVLHALRLRLAILHAGMSRPLHILWLVTSKRHVPLG